MDKICPLMSMQTRYNVEGNPEYIFCEKEKCAWWISFEYTLQNGTKKNVGEGKCSIRMIAEER